MADTAAPVSIDDLLRHWRWVRGLARHLVRDGDADELVQEVWESSVERRPTTAIGNPRAWLARVMLNRARSRARSEDRRRRREEAADISASEATTPEEAAARVEVQRMLAGLVGELPPLYQQVIYLRYFEDREPAEIAGLLGAPAGTIRWRLSEALGRLRTRLDEKYGKRSTWVALLVPLASVPAPAQPPPVSGSTVPTAAMAVAHWRWGLFVVLMGVAGLILATGWLLASRQATRVSEPRARAASVRGADRAGAGRVRPRTRPPMIVLAGGLGPPSPADGADDGACPRVQPIQDFLDDLRRTGEPWRDLRELHAESPPNAALEAAIQPLVARFVAHTPDDCEHSLACRGPVCELTVLAPDDVDRSACQPRPEPEFIDRYLFSGRNNSGDGGMPVHDPAKNRSYTKFTRLWRFHRLDGAAVPRAERTPLPDLARDFSRRPPGRPAGLSATCARRWERLARTVEGVEQSLMQTQAEAAFTSSAPDHGLSRRLEAWTRKVLDRGPGEDLPFTVTCRARICALAPRVEPDPRAINWQCRKIGSDTLCLPARDGSNWFHLLQTKTHAVADVARPPLRQSEDGAILPAYLVLGDPDRPHRPSPWATVLAFFESFDWRRAIHHCELASQHRGRLTFRLDLPARTGDERPPPGISMHLGGDLAGTDVGRCVSSTFEAVSAQFAVPDGSSSAVFHGELAFPFDPRTFEARLNRLRQTLREEEESRL